MSGRIYDWRWLTLFFVALSALNAVLYARDGEVISLVAALLCAFWGVVFVVRMRGVR